MKRKRIIAVVALCIISVIVLFIVSRNQDIHEAYDTTASQSELNEGVDDTFSRQITDINELLSGEFNGIIYFGRDSCPFCKQFNIALASIVSENSYMIYKFDTDYWRDHEYFDRILEKYQVTQIPTIVRVVGVNEFETFIYDESDDSIDRFEEELTDFLSRGV